MSRALRVNPILKGEDGHKVYNAFLLGAYHVNIVPVVQRPSGQVTYTWKSSCGRSSALGQVFDTRFLARDDAELTLGS